jgi:hypothetical protein
MRMNFSEETIRAIDNKRHEIWKENKYNFGVGGLELNSNGSIVSNGHEICDVDELSRFIKELTMCREAIEKTLGVTITL